VNRASFLSDPAILAGFVALLIYAYTSAWVSVAPAGLQMGAYDLAEWLSLIRVSPESLLLRAHLVLISVILGLLIRDIANHQRFAWVLVALPILLVLAQLPPPQHLLDFGNPNYRQQFLLALISAFGVSVMLSGRLGRIQALVIPTASLIGVIITPIAVLLSLEMMRGYGLEAEAAYGPVLSALCYSGIGAVWVYATHKRGVA
jgi:hypothetical protein